MGRGGTSSDGPGEDCAAGWAAAPAALVQPSRDQTWVFRVWTGAFLNHISSAHDLSTFASGGTQGRWDSSGKGSWLFTRDPAARSRKNREVPGTTTNPRHISKSQTDGKISALFAPSIMSFDTVFFSEVMFDVCALFTQNPHCAPRGGRRGASRVQLGGGGGGGSTIGDPASTLKIRGTRVGRPRTRITVSESAGFRQEGRPPGGGRVQSATTGSGKLTVSGAQHQGCA